MPDLIAFPRPSGRRPDELRPVRFQPDIAPHALGSVLVSFGRTQVICAATVDPRVPKWMSAQGVSGGWLTAEYSMLPYSTLERKDRDISRGKLDGRTVEIQRLIGRALRSVFDLARFNGKTLWIDCDVLQADGGTRTAAITGACLAARMAVSRLQARGLLPENPLSQWVAAISVGLFAGEPVLDLDYEEDKDATVDCNVVQTSTGEYVEVQGSGEEATYTHAQLLQLLALADQGIRHLLALQKQAFESWQKKG